MVMGWRGGGAAVCCINSLAVIDRADSGGNGRRGCLGKGKKSLGCVCGGGGGVVMLNACRLSFICVC